MQKIFLWFNKHKVELAVLVVLLTLLILDLFLFFAIKGAMETVAIIIIGLIILLIGLISYTSLAKKVNALDERPVYSEEEISSAKELTLVINEPKRDVQTIKRHEKIARIIGMVFTYAFLIVMAFVIIIPFYWMIITSLKTSAEIRDEITFFPQTIQWTNYVVLFKGLKAGDVFEGNLIDSYHTVDPFDFLLYMRNTIIVGVFSTIGTLITTILAAFAFARLNFKGKELLFSAFLATMMIPGEMMVITNYITVSSWLDTTFGTFAAMIVPFWVSTFYIYLLRQNFKQIPNELYYAAKVDGKTDWQYLWKVMVPLAAPTLITIFILKLMGAWNSYVWPNLVVDDPNLKLVTTGLRSYGASPDGNPHDGLKMAATVCVTVPLLLLFIFFRKYIMRGVGRAGIKG